VVYILYTVSQKHATLTLLTDFQNSFTVRISKKIAGNIFHHTVNVFFHYLAKLKCLYVIVFD